jgi:hypothetical protein
MPKSRRQEWAKSPFGTLADHFSLDQESELGIRTGVAASQSRWRAAEWGRRADATATLDISWCEHGCFAC